MNRDLLKAHLRYQLERHGWLAAVSLALLPLSVALQLLWVDGLHARNAQLRDTLTAQRRQQQQKPKEGADKVQRQAAFFASLPEAATATDAVAVLNQAAQRNQVALVSAEYRVTRQGSGPLLRYQLSVPLRADYVHLHAWLAQVMNALPNAALDDISFKREDASTPVLDARVRFTVFLRAP